jgi:hypothetical protein
LLKLENAYLKDTLTILNIQKAPESPLVTLEAIIYYIRQLEVGFSINKTEK